MPSRPPTVHRRALLGGSAGLAVVGVVGLSGCSDSLDPSSDDPTITPSRDSSDAPTTTGGAAPDDEPDDAALVAEVLGAIALAHRTARGTGRAQRSLTRTLRRVEALHVVHADELGGLPAATGQVTRAGDTPAQALARVDRAEQGLQQRLVDAATAAGSGALALTFASMAAAVAQVRTTLDVASDPGGDA